MGFYEKIVIQNYCPMRKVLFISVLLTTCSISTPAQATFNGNDYYQWFLKHAQTEQLYQDNSQLFIIGYNAKVRKAPYDGATIVTHLDVGQSVYNIAYPEKDVPKDIVNGYGHIWYNVYGKDATGRAFKGFIWGADIAKAWTRTDVDGDQREEFILLGVSSQVRQSPSDVKAEIYMLKDGAVSFRQTVPGLCLFQDCATSSLLRFIEDRGLRILEATTLTIGCDGGIEKMLMVWNGIEFEPVFHSERISQTEFINKEFEVPVGNKSSVQTCHFSHEDKNFNPVWICKDVEVESPVTVGKSTVKPKA